MMLSGANLCFWRAQVAARKDDELAFQANFRKREEPQIVFESQKTEQISQAYWMELNNKLFKSTTSVKTLSIALEICLAQFIKQIDF